MLSYMASFFCSVLSGVDVLWLCFILRDAWGVFLELRDRLLVRCGFLFHILESVLMLSPDSRLGELLLSHRHRLTASALLKERVVSHWEVHVKVEGVLESLIEVFLIEEHWLLKLVRWQDLSMFLSQSHLWRPID